MKTRHRQRGYSLLGMLIALGCVVVLFVIGMSALNRAVTGEGSSVQGTVRSLEDQLHLTAIFQGLAVYAAQHRDAYPVPSEISGTGDRTEDITANMYSALIAQEYVRPEHLVAGNEYSPWVEVDGDYDYGAYQPMNGVFWDPQFTADLQDEVSNVSYAHLPLFGRRYERSWRHTLVGGMPLVGNRGPRDGRDDPDSLTYGRDGRWAGHVLYGDGSIEYLNTFTPSRVTFMRDGQSFADNIFAVEDGPAGLDAILAFTRAMTADGPVLEYD